MTQVLTSLGKTIENVDKNKIKLDKSIKNVLSYRPILARIFKETIIECKNLGYDEIESCIEGEAQVDVVRLNPGETNTSKIEGRNQEDAVLGEGLVTFDIRTVLRIPTINKPIGVKLFVDIEPQKDDTPGYDITERAIFYCSRMISAQLDTEFTNSSADRVKYGNLKKVYSIWICTETSQKKANTIERYRIKKSVYPRWKNTPNSRYDLMEAIIVNIGKNHDTEGTNSYIIKLLTDLFDDRVDGKDKVKNLKDEYGLPTTTEFETEVCDMLAYTARIEKKGISQGISQGISKGFVLALINLVIKKVAKKKTLSIIVEELEEDIESIHPIYDAVVSNPGKSAEEIYDILFSNHD